MKKILFTAICALLPLFAAGQAQINTKKFVISDFKDKTLKVVESGDVMIDAMLHQEMQKVWHISPFEFCTMDEFNKQKKSPDFYFLSISDTIFGREQTIGIKTITLYKGNPDAGSDYEGMYKVVCIPFCSADNPDGRETIFLPALLNVVQNEIEKSMQRTFNLSDNVTFDFENTMKKWDKDIFISTDDLEFTPGVSLTAIYKDGRINFCDDDVISDKLDTKAENTLVGYAVGPKAPLKGSVCFTMLIDTKSYELFFMKKHTISKKAGRGFTQDQLRSFLNHTK